MTGSDNPADSLVGLCARRLQLCILVFPRSGRVIHRLDAGSQVVHRLELFHLRRTLRLHRRTDGDVPKTHPKDERTSQGRLRKGAIAAVRSWIREVFRTLQHADQDRCVRFFCQRVTLGPIFLHADSVSGSRQKLLL